MVHYHLMLMYKVGGVLPLVPLHTLDVHQNQSDILLLVLASTVILGSESAELVTVFYCLTALGVMKLTWYIKVSLAICI
jgi:hypothetical protein